MPVATLRQLLESGVHFGHQTSRWNPKMKPYIFTARNGIHIIDLQQTQRMLDVACEFTRSTVAAGGKVLFVGTKKQAQDSIVEACARTGQYYVVHRWMGGMLTNFQVIQRRLKELQELRLMKERGDFERMGNKEANVNIDNLERLERNFSGMVDMRRVPAALFVVDCKKEHLAVMEANRLRIPIIAIADSNVDPENIQHVIPGNDDAIRSVKLIITLINEAVSEGQQLLTERELREHREAEAVQARAAEESERAAAARAAEAENADGTAAVDEAEFTAAGAGAGEREA
jgi:small subunit ribosomal protein S2